MSFEEKAGALIHRTPNYSWCQTIDEVTVTAPLPEGTRGRNLTVEIKPKFLFVSLNTAKPPTVILKGELFGGGVQVKESVWTIEDDGTLLRIVLTKGKRHEAWKSVVVGEFELDALQVDEVSKKMLLERFQGENPGFDFSSATFNGNLPEGDPNNFMRFD